MYRILVADDEKWIRQGLVQAVDWARLNVSDVREAENGEQALALIEHTPPDVLISDIRMSGMGGLLLCEQVKNRYPDIRMILISGYKEFSFAVQAIKLGVKDYLIKPIDEEALLSSVARCLREVDALRAQRESTEETLDSNLHAHPIVHSVMKYVNENFDQRIGLSAVAEQVHMNPSYLSKLFCDESGVTFTQYLTKVRIEQAKKLLAAPEVRIYEIAQSTGYQDVKYFVRIFKEYTGDTPTEWRARRMQNRVGG